MKRPNEREESNATQIDEIVALMQQHLVRAEQARARGDKYRVALLGRTKSTLAPIAQALRQAKISFRAVELEPLAMRPEVLDVLALSRALYYPEDRVAWLGVLRAPWCGLSLEDLHTIAGDGNAVSTIPDLLRQHLHRSQRAAAASPPTRVLVRARLRADTSFCAPRLCPGHLAGAGLAQRGWPGLHGC